LPGVGRSACKIAWDAVRREWENLPIGLRALARRHGIRSDNQIRRRRDREGWRRNVEGIAAGRIRLMQAVDPAAPAAPTTKEGLAQLQGRVLKEQLATADALRKTAAPLQDHLTAILRSHDEAGIQDRLRRLTLAGKRDTLAELLQVMTMLIVNGSEIERGVYGQTNLPRGQYLKTPEPPAQQGSSPKPEDDPALAALFRRRALHAAYMTTPASLRQIAAQHGMRSDNSLRRLAKEGRWRRDGRELIGRMIPSLPPTEAKPPLAARGPAPSFPWAAIREAYETEPISLRQLAARFGVSESRIRARRDREGWTAEPKVVIERRLRRMGRPALGAIAELAKMKVTARPASVRTAHAATDLDTDRNGGNPPMSDAEPPPKGENPAQLPSSSSPVVRNPADPPGHSSASDPAEARMRKRQAAARLGQLESGKAWRELGLQFLGLARTLLTEPDEQELIDIKMLLTSLWERHSLVSILRTAVQLIMAGVATENAAVELNW
jgi:hypothetical protein